MLMGCIMHPRVPHIGRRVCTHIHSVGFCIAYSDILVFLGPQTADKQEKRSAFFDVRNGNTDFPYISHLNNDPANARELLRCFFV